MQFSEILIKRRRETGMTQDELADRLGVSRQSVSKWENGECMPDADKLIRLSDVLDLSLDELTGRTARAPKPESPKEPEAPAQPDAEPAPKTAGPRLKPLLLALAFAAFGAACFLIGRYLLPYNTNSEPEETPVPSVCPTDSPSPSPSETEAPAVTPAPTQEASVPDDWFIEEAWDAAKKIAAMYGVDYLARESWQIKRGDNFISVSFGAAEMSFAYISAQFVRDAAAPNGWRIKKCFAYVPAEEDHPKISADREAFGSCFDFEVTLTELLEAGWAATGTEADLEAAARLILDRFVSRFTELDGEDLMLCRDAKAVGLELRLFDPSTGWYEYSALAAVCPVNHRSFTLGFSEACTGWLYMGDEHPECRFYVELNVRLSARWNEDMRSISVLLDIEEPI